MTSALLEAARSVVAEVRDPEIPSLTIADLGILRDVRLEGDMVVVSITPTYSGCPAMGVIAEDITAALRSHTMESRIETVLSPAWTTDWMTDEAKAKLLAAGVGAPDTRQCPQCASDDLRTLSEYGSTACQSFLVCNACSETFPFFKAHR